MATARRREAEQQKAGRRQKRESMADELAEVAMRSMLAFFRGETCLSVTARSPVEYEIWFCPVQDESATLNQTNRETT